MEIHFTTTVFVSIHLFFYSAVYYTALYIGETLSQPPTYKLAR